jgi:signal transduction histidine kinase
MSPSAAERASAGSAQASTAAKTPLRGRKLLIARSLWLMLAAGLFVDFLVGIPRYHAQLQTVCLLTDPQHCTFYQLVPANVPALHQLGLSVADYAAAVTGWDVAISLLFVLVGALIFWRKSAEWYGLFVSLLLVTFGCSGLTDTLVLAAQVYASPMAFFNLLAGLKWPAMGFFLVTFPTGRFWPRWTWLIALLWLIQLLEYALPWPYTEPNWPGWLHGLNTLVVYGSTAAVQFYRYRRLYTPLERQQTKWLVFGFALGALVLGFADLLAPDSPSYLLNVVFSGLGSMAIILSLGIAILRYRLWDIDLVINRTLVYGLLSASVVGLYILVVGYLGALFRTGGNLLISLLGAALVAVLFQPLRGWLQRGVNRLMYGQRDEPYAVVARLSRRLESTLAPEAVLSAIVETVAQALKLPYAAITLKQGEEFKTAAAYGLSVEGTLTLPLSYQSEPIGQLVLGPRQRGEVFTPADRRLLDDLARQIGVAAHAVRLTSDLQRSRERLVTTREEERRRLRRDLHDGLGPTLGGLTLKVGAIRNLLSHDQATADVLLGELSAEIEGAVSDIRRLVYDLRPPSLDELGLVGAIRARAAHSGIGRSGERTADQSNGLALGLVVAVEAPEDLPLLPAAVEVAAYRIVLEALANVARHAQAQTCQVCLRVADALEVEVRDDGVGLKAARHTGVGLVSMRERAAELGGTCLIESPPAGGVRVLARLPLPKE